MDDREHGRLDDGFYHRYLGHSVEDLRLLEQYARVQGKTIVWLAGDSTLDNKFWVLECDDMAKQAPQNLKAVFDDEAFCRADVAYWMNTMNPHHITINTAVEEATIGSKMVNLNESDRFIQEHILEKDTLIVSIGGNDVAHKASFLTLLSLAVIILATPMFLWQYLAWTPPMRHLDRLFRRDCEQYVESLVLKTKPKRVLLCTVYYPDITGGKRRGWASEALKWLKYDSNPDRLQKFIDLIHDKCTSKIRVTGNTSIHHIALSQTLNGSDTKYYVQRVEPSVNGGKKIAETFSAFL